MSRRCVFCTQATPDVVARWEASDGSVSTRVRVCSWCFNHLKGVSPIAVKLRFEDEPMSEIKIHAHSLGLPVWGRRPDVMRRILRREFK